MKCEYCDNEVPIGFTYCPSCGAVVPQQSSAPILNERDETKQLSNGFVAAAQSQPFPQMHTQLVDLKSKWAFILLGIFLGAFGIHDFYLGYVGRGVTKLLITILSIGWLGWVSWIWGIVEICTVRMDAKGLPLES